MPLSEEQKQNIIQVLREKGALQPCEACNKRNFTLVDEVTQIRIAPGPNIIGGPSIPAIASVCNNCGNIRFHALGALNLLEYGSRK